MRVAVPRLSFRDYPALLQGPRLEQAQEQACFQAAGRQAWKAETPTQGPHFHAKRDGSRVSGQTRYGLPVIHQEQRKGMLSAHTNRE